MEVTLLPVNEQEVINKLYIACRTCYSAGTPNDNYRLASSEDKTVENTEKKLKLINRVISSGHLSTIEHQQLTFLISGVSRSLTHQLVRHRLCSFSQQSQRYVQFKSGMFDYVIPKSIQDNEAALDIFNKAMAADSNCYEKLIELGIPAEDARSVLPNACASNITMSLNLRELTHLCNERLCSCSQLEIRLMVREMVKETLKQLPFLKPYLVPKCEMLGYCNESKERSCGRKYTAEVVFGSLGVHN